MVFDVTDANSDHILALESFLNDYLHHNQAIPTPTLETLSSAFSARPCARWSGYGTGTR